MSLSLGGLGNLSGFMTGEVHGIQREVIRVCCAPGLTPIPSEGRKKHSSCLQQLRAEFLESGTQVFILGLNSASLEMVVSGHMPGGHVSKMASRAVGPGLHPLNKAFMLCAAVWVMLLSCSGFPCIGVTGQAPGGLGRM